MPSKNSDRKCAVDACDRPARGLQPYCFSHYDFLRRTGTPPTHQLGTLRKITTYAGVHNRLLLDRGKASNHACITCRAPAVDWAYNNKSENELTDESGRRYSVNINDYDPMCRQCHCRLDKSLVTECPEGHPYEGRNLIINQGKRICRACANAKKNAARRLRRSLGLPRSGPRPPEPERDETTPQVIADWVGSHKHPRDCAGGCRCERR